MIIPAIGINDQVPIDVKTNESVKIADEKVKYLNLLYLINFIQKKKKKRNKKSGKISTPYPTLLVTIADGDIAQKKLDMSATILLLNSSQATKNMGKTIIEP